MRSLCNPYVILMILKCNLYDSKIDLSYAIYTNYFSHKIVERREQWLVQV